MGKGREGGREGEAGFIAVGDRAGARLGSYSVAGVAACLAAHDGDARRRAEARRAGLDHAQGCGGGADAAAGLDANGRPDLDAHERNILWGSSTCVDKFRCLGH